MCFVYSANFSNFMWLMIFIIGICLLAFGRIYENQKLKKLKKIYDNALHGSDKKAALEAGKKYYAFKRPDGNPTIYDGIKIRTDISTIMK